MDAETIAILVFLVTLAVLAGYAAWRRWFRPRRHYRLDPDAVAAPPSFAAMLLQRVRMIHIVTMLLLLASFWIILSNQYDDDVQKWAFGAMGSIVGFWLRPID